MIDREKVTGHLNDCLSASRSDNSWVFVRKDIVSDALALLKEQENLEGRHRILVEEFDDLLASLKEKPHLMTVEELEALPVGSVVWEEYLDTEWEITRTELDPVMKTENGNLIGTNGYTTIMDGMGDADVDGNMWRWWSSRPTEEQRKAAKWDADKI